MSRLTPNHEPAAPKRAAPSGALARVDARLRQEAARQKPMLEKARDEARRQALCLSAAGITARLDGAAVRVENPVRSSLAEAMAGHMIELSGGGETPVTDGDLILRGFTADEIARHGAKARTLAHGMAALRQTANLQ